MKISKKLAFFSAIFVLFLITSCTSAKFSGLQVQKAEKNTANYTVLGEFDEFVNVNEFIGNSGGMNLGNVTATEMEAPTFDVIQKAIAKFEGDAAVDVVITQHATFLQVFLNMITGGIYAPVTVSVTGKVVKYN